MKFGLLYQINDDTKSNLFFFNVAFEYISNGLCSKL